MQPRRIFLGAAAAIVLLAALIPLGLWGWRSLAGRSPAAGTAQDGKAGAGKAGSGAEPAGEGVEGEAAGEEEEEGAAGGARPAPVSIEGLVTGDEARPVPGARVVVLEKRAWAGILEKEREKLWRDPFRTIRSLQDSLTALAPRKPSARSGEDGIYRVRGLREGEYRVMVVHPDFLPYRGGDWVAVEAGKTARHDVRLIPGLGISGRVIDSRGKAVPGARVRALPSETARLRGVGKLVQAVVDQAEGKPVAGAISAETDSRGAFIISSLEPGSHDLRAAKDGYAWKEARGVPAGAQGIVISLEPGIAVAGRIVGPDGAPVPRAAVILQDIERKIESTASLLALALADPDLFGERERLAAAGEDGRFRLLAFAAGPYDLTVRAEGFLPHRRTLTLPAKGASLGDITLDAAQTIAGRVLGPDGAPVQGAQVWVPPAAGRKGPFRKLQILAEGPSAGVASGTTDRAGAFRLTAVKEGTWEVAVSAAGMEFAVLDDIPTGSSDVEIRLGAGLRISGKVLDAESEDPLSGAKVSTGWGFPEALTDADGTFELAGVPRQGWETGGSIHLQADREGYGGAYAQVRLPRDGAAAEPVEIRLQRLSGGIHGIVRDPDGAPVPDAQVWLEVAGFPRAVMGLIEVRDGSRETRTGEDGSFSLALPRHWSATFEAVAARPGLARGRSGPLTRPEGNAPMPRVEIRLSPGSSIEGLVTGSDSLPLAGARVRAWRDVQITGEAALYARLIPRGAGGETAWSGKDGGFRLAGIEPGAWRLEATAAGYAARSVGPVEVGESAARVDLVLDPGGSLKGRVVDSEENPRAGVEVAAILIVGSEEETRHEMEVDLLQLGELGVASARTDAAGAYELTHLPEGEFRLVARAAGFIPGEIPSAIPGEPVEDLVLVPFSRIAGTVLDAATREPVRGFEVMVQKKTDEGDFEDDWRLSRQVNDPGGSFAYDSLRPGDYRIIVRSLEHVPSWKTVRLEPGSDAELKIALDPGSRVEGSVRRGDGTPVNGVLIYLSHPRQEEERPDQPRIYPTAARSGEDGRFVLKGLHPGNYRIFIRHTDYYIVQGQRLEGLQVPAAGPLDIVVELAGHLDGLLRDLPPRRENEWFFIALIPLLEGSSEGGRAAGAGKEGEPQPEIGIGILWIDENGKFQADSMKPGRYAIEFRKQAQSEEEKPEPALERRALGEVEIRAGETTRFEASLR